MRHRQLVGLTFAGLFAVWILLVGSLATQELVFGAVAAAGITWFSAPLLFTRAELPPLTFRRAAALVAYCAYLVREVVIANLHVAYIVLHPRLPISPGFVRFSTKLRSELGRAALANSITLTPGTLTVEAEQDDFLIHALTAQAAQGVVGWEAEDRLRRLEAAEG